MTVASQLLRQNLIGYTARRGVRARIARAAGVAPSTVTEWVQGKYNPDIEKLDAIAHACGCSVPQLFAPHALLRPAGKKVAAHGKTAPPVDRSPFAAAAAAAAAAEPIAGVQPADIRNAFATIAGIAIRFATHAKDSELSGTAAAGTSSRADRRRHSGRAASR